MEEAIEEARNQATAAKTAKEAADSTFVEADGRLTALRNLQREHDKAKEAYTAAYDRLQIAQKDFRDYSEDEKKNLAELLGKEGVDAVRVQVTAKTGKDNATTAAVTKAKGGITAAQTASATSETKRKQKAAAVDEYKQLAAAIGAGHTKLRGLREEVVKARQAGKYALAYWLLVNRGFSEVLKAAQNQLIKPDELPDRLLTAVKELAAAEAAKVTADTLVVTRRNELAEAEREAAEQKTNGENDLRAELDKIPAASA
ncbi:hypothetical protein BJF90_34880 [Pseudonocardia sp. CNS-004]|nr:hypothetical protein BJF90_34880 [Pseudonocardia sp. CNS-004]